MQRIVACFNDGFAFGQPDKFVLKKYDYLTTDDCLSLFKVRSRIGDRKYGHRYKLLYESIVAALPDIGNRNDDDLDETYIALVMISHGPLFVDIRERVYGGGREHELYPNGKHLQIYIPGALGDQRLSFWPAIGHGNDIPVDLSRSGLELAGRWLKECTSLADVGSDNTDVHLHISCAGEKGRWVALSHCWGNATPIKTTTSTIDEFTEGMPAQIPKTFADAIFVTRALGQRYLWIDSLCIIQDSPDDWVAESSLMHQVYSQALFTIVADAAEDSTSGFLQPPARRARKTSVLHYDLGAAAAEDEPACRGIVHVRERGELALQLPYHDFHVENSPICSKLSTRAWAFQERLLSPRTLHFGPSEMAWECRALCSCECSATNERTSLTTSLLKGSIALQPSPLVLELSARQVLRHFDNAWRADVVEEYTRLDLTIGTDRLHALAGVATQALSLRPGDQYIAGLWRNTIADGLSWYTTNSRTSSRLPGKNAPPGWSSPPSWSWAAVSGQIQHAQRAGAPISAPLIKVLSVNYQPSIASPMGAGPRRPAFLLAWGHLVPIQNIWYQHSETRSLSEDDPYYFDGVQMRSCYRVAWPPGVNLPSNCIAMMDIHKHVPPFDGKVLLDRLDGIEPDSDLVMLLTAIIDHDVYGLILRPYETSGAVPAYERVGFINGTDYIRDFISCNSTSASYRPAEVELWQYEEDLGICSILGGIGKTMIKIW